MFQIDDTVVYGSQGVCRVSQITEQKLAGKTMKYYILTPLNNSTLTIYVPVENETLTSKMRRVLSPEEIKDIIHTMPAQELIWVENDSERRDAYRDILSRGDTLELVQLAKTLFLRKQELVSMGKKLHSADETFLKDAETMLYDEFALVLNITREEVVPFITEEIQVSEKKKRG